MKIHTTAIISPQAEIADEVEIGPYTIVDGPARIASGCRIGSHVHLLGDVTLQAGCQIGPGTIIGADPQSLDFDPSIQSGVEVGEKNRIREYVTIHRSLFEGQKTRIGAGNFVMTGAHFGHDVQVGDHNVIANNCLLAGHVELGNRAFLGGGSVYHQFVKIGDFVMVQGLGGIGKDLPPFVIAAEINRIAGLNTVGLRRAGFTPAERKSLKRAYKLVFRSGLNLKDALEEAEKTEWDGPARSLFEFLRNESGRGFCTLLLGEARSIG